MKTRIILLLLILCTSYVFGQTLLSIDFENPPYVPGELAGQEQWTPYTSLYTNTYYAPPLNAVTNANPAPQQGLQSALLVSTNAAFGGLMFDMSNYVNDTTFNTNSHNLRITAWVWSGSEYNGIDLRDNVNDRVRLALMRVAVDIAPRAELYGSTAYRIVALTEWNELSVLLDCSARKAIQFSVNGQDMPVTNYTMGGTAPYPQMLRINTSGLLSAYSAFDMITVSSEPKGQMAYSVPLPEAEAGQPRTACASLCGSGDTLYFTRYWADVLPGADCLFYGLTGVAGSWTNLDAAPKYVQEPPAWFTTNIMESWAGDGLSPGEIGGLPYLFMFGSVQKGGREEDINRDLFGYNITADAWEIVTNTYDTGGADGACTFVAQDSIYGYWRGWTPMQRWAWDKNGQGVVQQATVGTAALHPVDGTKVGTKAVYIMFKPNAPNGRLFSIEQGGLAVVPIMDLPFNLGMGCAIEYVPAAYTKFGQDELWILRGGSGDNSGDGQGNNTPTADLLILTIDTGGGSVVVTGQRSMTLPYLTGAVGSDMARVGNRMYFLRHDTTPGADMAQTESRTDFLPNDITADPEMYYVMTDEFFVDEPAAGWPLRGGNKQGQGWHTNGVELITAGVKWGNLSQLSAPSLWDGGLKTGGGVTDGERLYIAVDSSPSNNNANIMALDLETGTTIWSKVLGGKYSGSTPALGLSGTLYVGDIEGDGNNTAGIYAVNKNTGAIIWQKMMDTMSGGGVMLDNGRLFFETDWNSGGVHCIEAANGASVWYNPVGGGEWASLGVVLSPDGSVVYGRNVSTIYAVDKTSGTTLWTQAFADGQDQLEPIVGDNGTIYCGFVGLTADTEPDVLIAFAPDGSTNWVAELGADAWSAANGGGYALSPDGSTIYCSCDLGLIAINTIDGSQKWAVNPGSSGSGCVYLNGGIIVGTYAGENNVVLAAGIRDDGTSGTILWSLPFATKNLGWLGPQCRTYPTPLPNGDVIVESTDGYIACISLPEPGLLGVVVLGMLMLLRRKR